MVAGRPGSDRGNHSDKGLNDEPSNIQFEAEREKDRNRLVHREILEGGEGDWRAIPFAAQQEEEAQPESEAAPPQEETQNDQAACDGKAAPEGRELRPAHGAVAEAQSDPAACAPLIRAARMSKRTRCPLPYGRGSD